MKAWQFALLLVLVAGCAHARSADAFDLPIRPGVPGVSPFWDGQAKQFIAPPAFDFKAVDGAVSYCFTLECADGRTRSFEAAEPWAPLTPVWGSVPVGRTVLTVKGTSSGGEVIAVAGTRQFHRAAAFDGSSARSSMSAEQSARIALASVVHEPFVQSWLKTGKPDRAAYPLYRYAAKIIGSLAGGCAAYAKLEPRPADAEEAIAIGRAAADYLISISGARGTALEFMPPTYDGAAPTERENDAWTMLMTPAEAAQGFLDLYDVTHDRKYRDAAMRVADTYAKLQRASGTWWLKVDKTTGQPLMEIDLIPSEVIRFLSRLNEPRYQAMLDRAIAWMMENPARTFNWQAQFDDAKMRGAYQNLAKHEACEFAIYLFAHRQHVALAQELLDFSEDQFVTWSNPPALQPRQEVLNPKHWILPCSCEQYAMFEPISGSSAFMINAYLAAYRATGNRINLAKAQALANALTVAQQMHGGRYPTRMIEHDLAYWLNSTINTAKAMDALARVSGRVD